MIRTLLFGFALCALAATVGCGGTAGGADAAVPPDLGGPPPPDFATPAPICHTPTPPGPGWFTDVTQTALTAPNPTAKAWAVGVHAADLDGDGYPDLITTGSSGDRDTAMTRSRFVWMNRPDPSDPSGKTRMFVDETDKSHLMDTRDGKGGYAFGVANIGDLDNDGDPDVVVGPANAAGDPAVAMLNDGKGHFKLAPTGGDLETESGNEGITPASAILFDFDKDGLLDYMPATFAYPPPNMNAPMLMKGSGDGRFTDVTDKFGINTTFGDYKSGTNLPSMYGVSACDLDGDGDTDILLADYGREPNFIYRNDGDHFTEIGKPTGLAEDDRLDYSDDQSYRCYCANRPGVCKPQPPPPDNGICNGFGLMLKCQGGRCNTDGSSCKQDIDCADGRGWQVGDSDQPWRLGGNNFSLACGDFDDDGDMDVMSATIRHGDTGSASDPSELIVNVTPPGAPLMKFMRPGNVKTGLSRAQVESGINWNEGDMTPVFVDLDLDGRKDLYLTSSDYPGDHGWVWHQKPDHTFEDITTTSRIGQREAHGIAFADFDRDGDLDVAIGTSNFRNGAPTQQLHIYLNTIGQTSNWTQIALVGKGKGGTNRSGIGARVKVTAGGKTQYQELYGGYGHTVTQNDLILTFGLGAACAIDSIEVRWLDKASTVQTFTNVLPNYRIRLHEGQDAVEYLRNP